jgi:Fe-S cluster assembly ATP-binding protein
MALLEPRLAILDETDSGLDIDALKMVADGVNRMRNPERSIVVVTHYQRLLDYIVPDVVHVLTQGRIAKSGSAKLAQDLEQFGYGWIDTEFSVAGFLTRLRGIRQIEMKMNVQIEPDNLSWSSFASTAMACPG